MALELLWYFLNNLFFIDSFSLGCRKCRQRHVQNDVFNVLCQPSARFFHGAVSTDQYMVVLGGRTLDGSIDTSVFIYRFACNHWTNITSLIHTGN